MATLSSFSQHLIRHSFVLRCPAIPFLFQSLKTQTKLHDFPPLRTTPYLTSRSLFVSTPLRATSQEYADDVASLEIGEIEPEIETTISDSSSSEGLKKALSLNLGEFRAKEAPSLSVKEKKELASYAHGLGKKLKSQQVGKSGVTDTVVTALLETLEKNELLKLKIHNNCPAKFEDAVKLLEETTGSVVVGKIGRTIILYRPSLAKLKAEEKKKQAQGLFLKRQAMAKQYSLSRRREATPEQESRQYGRGRRGSSRI